MVVDLSKMEKSETSEIMTDNDRIRFLESLLSHYEALVQDMSGELLQCKNSLNKLTVSEAEGRESDLQCTKCEMLEMRFENLRKQLETVSKAKEIQHCLWKSCMEQLEKQEVQKVSFHSLVKDAETKDLGKCRMPMPTVEDLFTKWKLLQIYTTGLESRLEKTVLENKMYRRRLLETKLENEVELKKQAAARIRDIESVKNSFTKEMEYLKASVEKSRKTLEEAIEERVEKEYATWKNEENGMMQELEQKIQAINADREALLIRDNQMSIQLREIAKELLLTRKQLQCVQQEKWRMEIMVSSLSSQIQSHKESKSKVVDDIPPVLYTTEVQTEEIQEVKLLKESRTQMQQLQDDFTKLLDSKALIKRESKNNLSIVLGRLKELERVNSKLESKSDELEKEKSKVQLELDQLKRKVSLLQCVPNAQQSMSGQGDVIRNTNARRELETMLDIQRIEAKRMEIREMTLTDHIRKIDADRQKLMTMLDKQKSVSMKWEREYKTLLSSLES